MDKKALQLNSRFSLPPNSLGYCGKNSALEKFKSCVINGNCEGVEKELKKFIVLYPYLRTISKISGLPKFSYKVIESYWVGNELLSKTKEKDYGILLNFFEKQGVPKWLIRELKNNKPKRFIPSHLFQVLHVGVGRVSGSVPYNLDTINNCMVRWGEVKKITKKTAILKLNSLKKTGNSFCLTQVREAFPFIPGFVPGLKVGHYVTVHWKQITKILTKKEIKNIKYWTNKVVEVIN